MLLFTRYLLSFADSLGDPIVRTATAMRLVPLRPRVPRGRVRPGVPKDAGAAPLTSEFVGMARYAPTCFLDLMADDVESDGSSIGDVAPSHHPS